MRDTRKKTPDAIGQLWVISGHIALPVEVRWRPALGAFTINLGTGICFGAVPTDSKLALRNAPQNVAPDGGFITTRRTI
jgi:hypothetical protein